MSQTPPTEQPAKPAIQSTTYQGLALIVVAQLVGPLLIKAGITAPGVDMQVATAIVTGAGLIIAAVGRYTAKHKISGIFKVAAK